MNWLTEPFGYQYMLNAMWGLGDGRRPVRISLLLSDAQRLVADWRCAVAPRSFQAWPEPIC
ncbi:iron ABC transporter permease [Citrobacter freundii]|nr:iron ABC transporter permease [Citrobacter freundii]